MKRLAGVLILITLFTMTTLWSQEKKKEPKKNTGKMSVELVTVDKVKPAPEDVKAGFESIDGEDGLAYLKFLASDALEGRDTASLGYQVAAEFAATLFESWGLKPAGDKPAGRGGRRMGLMRAKKRAIKPTRSYLQQVELKRHLDTTGSAHVEWNRGNQRKAVSFEHDVDYRYQARKTHELSAPVVFVGYGMSEKSLKFDEYKNVDVKGKIVMMLTETPRKGEKDSPFETKKIKKKYYAGRGFGRRRSSPKSRIAMEKGAIAVLLVENSPETNRDVAKDVLRSRKINDERPIVPGKSQRFSLTEPYIKYPFETIPTLRVSRQMANQILELSNQDIGSLKSRIEDSLKPASMSLTGVTFTLKHTIDFELAGSPNVLGYIEGSDPELKDEVIVIGAHLDHLGKRGDYIFNGADDNGSGSALVLEVAQAFSVNPVKPKRTVVFALWTGEEKGLLGSRYYVAHPAFPREKTVAYFNCDMVSRLWDKKRLKMMLGIMGYNLPEEDFKKLDVKNLINFNYIQDSPELLELFKKQNEYVGLTLAVRKSAGRPSRGGSDHIPFSYVKIPWVFFMGAMTQDYHQPNDTYEKISVSLMKNTTRLVYLGAMSLANK